MGFFFLGRDWLRTVGLDGDVGLSFWEESRFVFGLVFWLFFFKINLFIVMRLFLGCSLELFLFLVEVEFSFLFFFGFLFLRVGDGGDIWLGSIRFFWFSFEKVVLEFCVLDRVLKVVFRVIILMVVGVFRSCL